jgi:hypothetical protein
MRMPWQRERADPTPRISIDAYADLLTQFSFLGTQYTLPGERQEEIGAQFRSLSQSAYKQNGVVFACVVTRMLLFSEARFQYQRLRGGRPAELFGNASLGLLESPWPNGTTGDLLTKAIQYVDLAGNFFAVRRPGRLKVLRPDWVSIVLGSRYGEGDDHNAGAWDVESEVVGYAYTVGGPYSGNPPEFFETSEVVHWAPIPDPMAEYRGMSWITPVVREVMGDKAATEHKLKFFENGATPNLVVKLNVEDIETMTQWIELFKEKYEGYENAYKTMFVGAGHDVTSVGTNFEQLEFKVTQGAGETRIAAAARVPPIIVGLSEGLQAATYSNYGMARRAFADATMRPLWRSAAGSFAKIVPVPGDARLWYDDRDISFLQDDKKDEAEIVAKKASAIKTLVDAGFEPDTAVMAVDSLDLSRLDHSGLLSVQLQEPGAASATGSPNGSVPVPVNGATGG